MTNDECQITNEIRIPNAQIKKRSVNYFGFCHSSFIRHSSFVIRHLTLLLFATVALAQKPGNGPTTLDPKEGERRARVLIAEILSQKPDQAVTNTGVMTIRDAEGNRREIRVRFALRIEGNKVLSIYDAVGSDGSGTRLTVVQAADQPNQYEVENRGLANGNVGRKILSGKDAMIPFAGSDFWLADFGLEFLRWPQQRILRTGSIRHNQSCAVLESINPDAASSGYARVESWIDLEAPHGVVHADAYDSTRKRVKQFDPKSVKKIEGQYKLEAMEMLDEKTGSRTAIKFDLKAQ
jgi:hypothetical protein